MSRKNQVNSIRDFKDLFKHAELIDLDDFEEDFIRVKKKIRIVEEEGYTAS